MNIKTRLNKVEKVLTERENYKKNDDPHGKRTPFRVRALDLWESGDYISLKEHCAEDMEFYELLVSYSRVIEKVIAQNEEIQAIE
ncbi:hypothetical protein V7157_15515 [Neobacillus drentensis]|uniref:hypothetical protein n=1 Tax=Neobacillus drentensis TaxID=220684 RepID=UPI0030032896